MKTKMTKEDLKLRIKRDVLCKDLLESGDNGLSRCPKCGGNEEQGAGTVEINQDNTWSCSDCGAHGDSIDLIRQQEHCDYNEALRRGATILRLDWDNGEDKKPDDNAPKPYTLEQYAEEKHLSLKFLTETCKLSTKRDYRGIPHVCIPYLDEDGKELTHRKRYGDKDLRWKKGTHAREQLYGLHLLPRIRELGYTLLVEGESDTQTLWHLGFPALGVPGAGMFAPEETKFLRGLKVYVHQEPDKGGETFVATVRAGLDQGGFDGDLRLWKCSDIDGSKDPSDLYLANGGEEAKRLIEEALKNASTLALKEIKYIEGAPIELIQPPFWQCSPDKGICIGEDVAVSICRTPILLTKRLINLAAGTEKVEVSFHRDGYWRSVIVPRSTLYQRKSVTDLANYGCTVTSENARDVVRFLSDLEAVNAERIPKTEMASTYGWQRGNRFFPSTKEEILPDPDLIPREVSEAFSQCGSLDKWLDCMIPLRSRDAFRFQLAASFAAPLLRIVRQRNFVVYNWCSSRGGKTATLKAAASVWGNPEGLMINFHATVVGLERTASLFCDIPLIIDERQLSTDDQRSLDKVIYLISNGKGKTKGTKGGGLQRTGTWRTIALCSGEEPVTAEDSQTGVSSRMLEIYGPPIGDEQEAAQLHQRSVEHYGHAGLAFVEQLSALSEDRIREAYKELCDYVRSISDGKNLSHVSSVAVVALADAMADSWLFSKQEVQVNNADAENCLDALGILDNSWERAKEMADNILCNQVQVNASDVNDNAVQYIVDWVLSNQAYFGSAVSGTCYGMLSLDKGTAWIYPSHLDEALRRHNYNPAKTKRYMAEKGYITSTMEASTGKRRYTVLTRNNPGATLTRMVEFRLKRCMADFGGTSAGAKSTPQAAAGKVIPMYAQNE